MMDHVYNYIQPGTIVRVRWDDGELYEAKVLKIPAMGRAKKFLVLFDVDLGGDGSHCKIKISSEPDGVGIYEIVSGEAAVSRNSSSSKKPDKSVNKHQPGTQDYVADRCLDKIISKLRATGRQAERFYFCLH